MTYPVHLRPEAEADLEEAANWYEQQRDGLGHEFLDTILSTLDSIAENPELYPLLHSDVRRAVMQHFPFGV